MLCCQIAVSSTKENEAEGEEVEIEYINRVYIYRDFEIVQVGRGDLEEVGEEWG